MLGNRIYGLLDSKNFLGEGPQTHPQIRLRVTSFDPLLQTLQLHGFAPVCLHINLIYKERSWLEVEINFEPYFRILWGSPTCPISRTLGLEVSWKIHESSKGRTFGNRIPQRDCWEGTSYNIFCVFEGRNPPRNSLAKPPYYGPVGYFLVFCVQPKKSWLRPCVKCKLTIY